MPERRGRSMVFSRDMLRNARAPSVLLRPWGALVVAALSACSGTESGTTSPDGSTAEKGGAGNGGETGGASSGGPSSGGAHTGGGGAGGNATGGASGGAVGAGGSTGSGGASPSGGAAGTGGSTGGVADPAEMARVTGFLTNTSSGLPSYAYDNIKKNFATQAAFDTLVHAIVMSCAEFAPSEPNWTLYCEAVLTSAIVAESSYDPQANVLDTYGKRDVSGTTANDPTVGLLQIRFSSTVQDYNSYGPLDKIAAIGCTWPAAIENQTDPVFWATAGGTTYVSFMEDVSCNIGLAAWYYFTNATGNGGPTPIYSFDYCQGNGIAGNMVIGLLSHLEGPGFPRPPDATNPYVTGIKARFATLLGGLPNPDPFGESLAPEPAKYCR